MERVELLIPWARHEVEITENWNTWERGRQLKALRETQAMIKTGGRKLVKAANISKEFIEEIDLRIAVTEAFDHFIANLKTAPDKEVLKNARHLYGLYTGNDGQGMRVTGTKQEHVDNTRKLIEALTRVVAGETIAQMNVDIASRNLMDAMEKGNIKSVYLPHNDILGKENGGGEKGN